MTKVLYEVKTREGEIVRVNTKATAEAIGTILRVIYEPAKKEKDNLLIKFWRKTGGYGLRP